MSNSCWFRGFRGCWFRISGRGVCATAEFLVILIFGYFQGSNIEVSVVKSLAVSRNFDLGFGFSTLQNPRGHPGTTCAGQASLQKTSPGWREYQLPYVEEKKRSTFGTHLRHHQKVSEKIWKISHRCNSMRSFIWSNRIQKISSQSKVILIFPRGSRKIRPSIFYFEGGNVRITQDSEEISQIWLHHSKERHFLGLGKFSWDFSGSFWQ